MSSAKKANTKLTPEVQDKIITAVKTGTYLETAAAFAGIGKRTLHRWLHRGAQMSDAPEDKIYRAFSLAVEEAMAHADVRDLSIITKAAMKGVWQAAAWRLERRHPDKWGRRQVIQVGTDESLMRSSEVELANLTDDELDQLERIMKKGKKRKEELA